MKSTTRFCPLDLLLLFLAFALAGPVSAATITWNGGNGAWIDSTKWSPQVVPGAGDTTVISGAAPVIIAVTGNQSTDKLVLDNPNASLRVVGNDSVGSSTLTVANGFENRGTIELTGEGSNGWSASLTVTSGTLTNATGGVMRVLPGTVGGPRNLNANLDNRGNLNVEHDLSLSGNVANSGTVHLPEGKTLTVQGTTSWTHRLGAITGTGTLSLPSGSTFVLEEDFTPGTFLLNAPNLTVNGPAKLLGPATGEFLIRSWTINAEVVVSGDLRVEGNVSFNSALRVSAGKTLRVVGNDSVGSSTLTVANGFENRGTIELTGEGSNGWSASLTVTSGTLTNATGGVMRVLPGTVGGPRNLNANLDNRGNLNVEHDLSLSGNVANSGTVHLPEGKTLTVQGTTSWTHRLGAITGTGTLSLPSGSTFVLEEDFIPGTFLLNAPNLTVNGPAKLLGPATGEFLIRSWTINAEVVVSGDLRVEGNVSFNSALRVSAGKTLRVVGNDSVGSSTLTVANGFENRGSIELTGEGNNGWSASLTVTSGTLTNATGGVMRVLPGTVGGPRNLNANLDNRGELLVLAGTTLNVSGNLLNASSGILGGGGTFNLASATVTNDGAVAPGASPSLLSITGSLPWSATALLNLELGGFTSGTEHDQLALANAANLDGIIRVSLINGFFPKKDDTFTVLTYPSRTGTFATLDNPLPERIAYRVDYVATSARVVVLNTAPTLVAISNQTANEQTPFSVTASATDEDLPAQSMTYALATAPTGMTINPATGQISWTPTEAQGPGEFDVTVRVTDSGTPALGHATRFTVTVKEANVAPQLVLPAPVTASEQAELVFTINGTDADVPANPLTYELVSGPPGAKFNTTTRELRWTPTEAQGPGSYIATFRVTDSNPDAVSENQLSATGEVSLTVAEVNRQPALAGLGNQTATEATLFSISAMATDSDLPANGLTYSLDTAPTGMAINPTTGTITWTPTEGQGPGDHNVTVRVTDNGSPALAHTTSFSVTVSEANLPPALNAMGHQTAHEESLFSVTATATDPDLPANDLTYSLETAPTGMTINPVTGMITWTPTEAQGPGAHNVTVRVTDNGSPARAHTTGFIVTVGEVNLAPALISHGPQTVGEETELVLALTGADADLPANPLTYELVSGPEGLSLNPATGVISWTPTEAQGPGTFTVSVRVTDTSVDAVNAKSLSGTGDFQISVTEVNRAPIAADLAGATVHAGTPFTASLTATDPDLPANPFTFSLISSPTGMAVSSGGSVSWNVPLEAAGSLAEFTVRVTDAGSPAASSERRYQVNVAGPIVILGAAKSGDQLEITWRALSGKRYRLVRAVTLPILEWLPVPGEVLATGETASKNLGIDSTQPSSFLRVELVP